MSRGEVVVEKHLPAALSKILKRKETLSDFVGLGSNREIWLQTEIALDIKRALRAIDKQTAWRVAMEAPGPRGLTGRRAPVDLFVGKWRGAQPVDDPDNVWVECKILNEYSFGSNRAVGKLASDIARDLKKLAAVAGHRVMVVFLIARTSHIDARRWTRTEPSRVLPRMWAELTNHPMMAEFVGQKEDCVVATRLDFFCEPFNSHQGEHQASFGYGLLRT